MAGKRRARRQLTQHTIAILLEAKEGVYLLWISDIDEMVRNGRIDFGVLGQVFTGTDVETAVNLSRVGRYDLRAQAMSNLDPEAGLAASGRADDCQDVEPHFSNRSRNLRSISSTSVRLSPARSTPKRRNLLPAASNGEVTRIPRRLMASKA